MITDTSLTLILPDGPRSIRHDHPNFSDVTKAVRDNWDVSAHWFAEKMTPIVAVKRFVSNYRGPASGVVEVTDDAVLYNGEPVHNAMTERMLNLLEQGFNLMPWVNFMVRLKDNPSFQSQQELYGFLEANNLPLTEDGCFMAYKRVDENYMDIHSGRFNNAPGQAVSMPRGEVNDNRNITCSTGLHVCAWDYLPHYAPGSKVVMVKVSPAHVVSVPVDYDNAKMRTCAYFVVADVTDEANAGPLSFSAVVRGDGENWRDEPDYGDDDWDEDEDEDDEACADAASAAADEVYQALVDFGIGEGVAVRLSDLVEAKLIENDCN